MLGFDIADIMFNGSDEDLKQTKVTQPAIFSIGHHGRGHGEAFNPDFVAGTASGNSAPWSPPAASDSPEGLKLVSERAQAMQAACEATPSTMAAILGMEDADVEAVCAGTEGIVVAANYNCPGQLVISGEVPAIESACEQLKEAGARRALVLPVGGAFHSPLMEPARERLAQALEAAQLHAPRCPIVQNVTATPETDPEVIRQNLIAQLTAPVRWTQTMQWLLSEGVNDVVEVGPGRCSRACSRRSTADSRRPPPWSLSARLLLPLDVGEEVGVIRLDGGQPHLQVPVLDRQAIAL